MSKKRIYIVLLRGSVDSLWSDKAKAYERDKNLSDQGYVAYVAREVVDSLMDKMGAPPYS
jgi:hypothetical protein